MQVFVITGVKTSMPPHPLWKHYATLQCFSLSLSLMLGSNPFQSALRIIHWFPSIAFRFSYWFPSMPFRILEGILYGFPSIAFRSLYWFPSIAVRSVHWFLILKVSETTVLRSWRTVIPMVQAGDINACEGGDSLLGGLGRSWAVVEKWTLTRIRLVFHIDKYCKRVFL